MKTIEAFEKDIDLQLDLLDSIKLQKPLSENIQKKTIFAGSGDSLVSAMLAHIFSGGMVQAMDPLDLLYNKNLAKSKNVYFISISGNTIANIKVAKSAKKSIAITAKSNSRLARVSDKTILLQNPTNSVFTAGSVSFLESALTCISLVRKIRISNYSKIFSQAKKDAKKYKVSKKIYVLGNMFTYPLAMYCAAKFYEVMGYDVHYAKIEQFSHMELFSTSKGDTVILFEEKNKHNTHLVRNLSKAGLKVIHPNLPKNKISQMLYCTFFSQQIALNEAKKNHKKECHFVTAKQIRNVSNSMIY